MERNDKERRKEDGDGKTGHYIVVSNKSPIKCCAGRRIHTLQFTHSNSHNSNSHIPIHIL